MPIAMAAAGLRQDGREWLSAGGDLVLDGGAMAVPYVPAGMQRLRNAPAAARALRGADKAADAVKAAGKAPCPPPPRISGEALAKARGEFNKMKPQAWKDEAARNPQRYTPDQLARMRNGDAPIGGDGYPMEMHHRTPLAEGGQNSMDNFEFMTRSDHRLGDNYKKNHPNLP
jgi:hypothetical protein